jgi:hypothetical protein
MKIPMRAVSQVVETLIRTGARKATKYLAKDTVVRAARRRYRGRGLDSRYVILTLGRPNYEERAFIRTCRKAGESFPVKKIQLRFQPRP